MKILLSLALGYCTTVVSVLAGVPISPAKQPIPPEKEERTFLPDNPPGLITLGGAWSEHLSGVYLDSITGLWTTPERDAFLFLDSLYRYEDNGQFLQTNGLAFRKILPGHDIIIGGNVYYDAIHSEHGNDFNQLGLGVEVLTRWVDARFNYYLPEDTHYEVDRSTRRESTISRDFIAGTVTERNTKRTYKQFEAGLEGFNTEIGFLVPGVDRYAEVRLFAGYHHYNNPFGDDFEGFQARLEARLLPGVIADVEYWDDTALMGGHWTAGIRVSVPFSIFNLATGRNPFEGYGEYLRPRKQEFKERLAEMVIRPPRIQTVTSGKILTSRKSFERTTVVAAPQSPVGPQPFPAVPIE